MSATLARTSHVLHPETLERITILGPTVQFLTDPADEHAPCIMRGTIPPGVLVPLHSHADPETFFMLSGTIEGLIHTGDGHRWTSIRPGEIFHVPPDAKHGWRNQSREPAVMYIVTTSKLGRFFQEVGVPVQTVVASSTPSAADIDRFMRTAAKYGYWNATPQENVEVGIVLPRL
jgi:quercetin dioxygenase-like cupin family protein